MQVLVCIDYLNMLAYSCWSLFWCALFSQSVEERADRKEPKAHEPYGELLPEHVQFLFCAQLITSFTFIWNTVQYNRLSYPLYMESV